MVRVGASTIDDEWQDESLGRSQAGKGVWVANLGWMMGADFEQLPLGLFSWSSFVISSLLFGALHGGFWLAGTIAGMAFAIALYQRRALGDAVLAHATTNGLIAFYVLATGRWSMWG